MLEVTLITDPACPFAFSAEPVRQRLVWDFGDALVWSTVMIVLTHEPGEAEKLAQGAPGLQRKYGMPIDPRPRARPASSEPACRAVIAARLHAPGCERPLLRRLQVRGMAGGVLDDPALIAAAASDVGLDADRLADWSSTRGVEDALGADVAFARDPAPAARALDHKLGGPRDQRRYTAPSYVIGDAVIPGFNPHETYDAVIANQAPDLPRRRAPESVDEILAWAPEPLATAEVALIMRTSIDEARAALGAAGAGFTPAGADGYWSDSTWGPSWVSHVG